MGRGLAYKRHQERRMRDRAIRKGRAWDFDWMGFIGDELTNMYSYTRWIRNHRSKGLTEVKKYKFYIEDRANNMKRCSCFMCGNPRKFLKYRTKQEVLSLLSFREQEKYSEQKYGKAVRVRRAGEQAKYRTW